jgi:hypothetical protein
VSGKPFTLRGNCFGDKGSLELIGQFSPRNGPFIVPVYTWTNTEIVAGMPSVDKVPDHTIAVSVLRVDGKRSDAKQARFIAERALVPVDPGFWHPTSHFSLAGVSESLDTIFGSQTFQGTGAPNRFVNRFNITINSACSLDSMDVPSTIGGVHAINGWDNGPPHSANIDIVWSPTCTTNTTDFVVGTHQVTRCAVDFELRARASCPRGINP